MRSAGERGEQACGQLLLLLQEVDTKGLPADWREPGESGVWRPGGECQEREPSTASRCWEIGSGDCRETTSGFGNTVAVGDTDRENGVTFNSLFQKQGS